MHLQNMTAGFLWVRVGARCAEEEKQQESLCLLIQNATSHAHAAASRARLVLAEQFVAIKACKLIAQQNNSPSLIPV